jgi:hypothetical protein
MDRDINVEANRFIYGSKVGDFYMVGQNKIEVVKRTPKRIHFSNGVVVSIRTLSNGMNYLSSRSVVSHNKSYPIVDQMIRNIEGYRLQVNHRFNVVYLLL